MYLLVNHYTDMFKRRSDNQLSEHNMNNRYINQISGKHRVTLEAPLEMEEMEIALKNMSKGKSPGSDSSSVEFYQSLWNDIKVLFFQMVKDSIRTGALAPTLNEGVLTLVPKPGRPRNEIKSYRPIAYSFKRQL